MRTRNMANQQIKTMSQVLGTFLKEIRGKEKIEFFDVTQDTWDKLGPALEQLFPGTEVNRNVETIERLFNEWNSGIASLNGAVRTEIDLAARIAPAGLVFSQDGRKAW